MPEFLLPTIVFDNNDTVARVHQTLKRDKWAGDIDGMQTRCRFVEQMEGLLVEWHPSSLASLTC